MRRLSKKEYRILGLTKLYPEQVNALFHFLSRENVFVNLPTSYGKSMILQIAPLVASELSKSCTLYHYCYFSLGCSHE